MARSTPEPAGLLWSDGLHNRARLEPIIFRFSPVLFERRMILIHGEENSATFIYKDGSPFEPGDMRIRPITNWDVPPSQEVHTHTRSSFLESILHHIINVSL